MIGLIPARLVSVAALAMTLACATQAQPHSVQAAEHAASAASASDPDLQRGRRLFQRYCTVCHGLRGEGGMGPSMKGIAHRISADQISQQIREPRGSMPRLYPSPIDDRALADLRAYLLQMP